MSNYVQTTFFTPKDSLPTNNPAKTIFGAAYDVELGNISTAIASKVDTSTAVIGLVGTANQVAVSAATGTITISLPTAVIITGTGGVSAFQALGTGIQAGAPTGGDQGVGTINVAGNYFVNGVALSQSGNFTATCGDISGSPTVTLYWSRNGNTVTISSGTFGVSGTSTTLSLGLTGLPVALQPARQQNNTGMFPQFADNAVGCGASSAILTNGTITFVKLTTASPFVTAGWTASGTKTMGPFTFSYVLN